MVSDREKLVEQFGKLIGAFADPFEEGEIIYHYTSDEGLRGIVESNEIWLTNTEFVNDTTECKALQREKNLLSSKELTNDFVEKAGPFINTPDKHNNIYLISFSKNRDSLEQWRAYGNYCIGFDAKKLIKRPFNLCGCIYKRDDIRKWILEKEAVPEWKGDGLDKQAKMTAAFSLIDFAAKKYKNKSYEFEEEVRLITISNHKWQYPNSPEMYEQDPPIHFRDHPVYKTPIPYVKFFIDNKTYKRNQGKKGQETTMQMKRRKLEEEKSKKRELLPIKEVRIGPMLHQEKAKIACEILLCEKGYERVQVIPSEIPYRGF